MSPKPEINKSLPVHSHSLRYRFVAGGVVLLAAFFAFRGVAWWEFSHTVYYTQPLLDAKYYDQLARRVAEGHWQQNRAFFMGPGYPYALGIAYSVFGPQLWVGRALNLACSLFSMGLIFWLGRKLSGTAGAFGAAALWALYRPAIFFEETLLMEVMAGALGLACVAVAVAWFGKRSDPNSGSGPIRRPLLGAFLCGAVLGLAALARANVLAFTPFLGGWILWRVWKEAKNPAEPAPGRAEAPAKLPGKNARAEPEKEDKNRRAVNAPRPLSRAGGIAGLFVLGLLVAISPAAIHNARAERDFVAITSNAGINLYIGNNPRSLGYFVVPKGINFEQDPRGERLAAKALGRTDLSSTEISHWWENRALAWIRQNPGAFLLNTFRKFALLFTAGEIPQIYDQVPMRNDLPFLRWPLVTFLLLCPLAAIGITAGLRRSTPTRSTMVLLVLYLVSLMVSLLPFFVTGRYRLPMIPAVCVAGGAGIAALIEAVRSRATRRLEGYCLLGVVFAAATFGVGRLEPQGPEEVSEFESMHAAILLNAGKRGEAQALLEHRAAIAPTSAVWSNLGKIYDADHRPDKAAEVYEKASRLQPDDARIWFNLSQALLRTDRHKEAREALERTIQLDPDVEPLAWYNLALLRAMTGDRPGAKKALKEYLKRRPNDAQAKKILRSLEAPPATKKKG